MNMQETMEHLDVTGTFAGHVLPGSLFIVWALYWIGEALLRDGPTTTRALESGLLVPATKVVLPLVGAFVEIPGQGWYPADVMTNWQHVTMYVTFALTGVVDLLARRGALSDRATYLAFAAASLNAGFLFWGHGRHGGVPGVVHSLLVVLFAATAAFAVLEAVRPSESLAWARRGSLLALGTWFVIAAWILYRSGWDLADPVREGWSYMVFSWNAVAAAVLVMAAFLSARRRKTGDLATE